MIAPSWEPPGGQTREPRRGSGHGAQLCPQSAAASIALWAEPDCAWIHRERSRPGVTLELLHLEYLEANPVGYQYTAFCDRYRALLKRRGVSMRQHHVAGDRMFVDYSGQRARPADALTAEVIEVELVVAVASRRDTRTRRRRTRSRYTQQAQDFVGGHVRAFECSGGVARAMVSDNPQERREACVLLRANGAARL